MTMIHSLAQSRVSHYHKMEQHSGTDKLLFPVSSCLCHALILQMGKLRSGEVRYFVQGPQTN